MIPQGQSDFLKNHIIDKLTEFIINDYNTDLKSALKMVYQSKVYELIQNKEGELYSQSPSYIYELIKPEVENKVKNLSVQLGKLE